MTLLLDQPQPNSPHEDTFADYAAIYATAADILEERGHWRGGWRAPGDNGPCCAGYAILEAADLTKRTPSFRRYTDLFKPLRVRLSQTCGHSSIANWNDDEFIPLSEILTTLRSFQ